MVNEIITAAKSIAKRKIIPPKKRAINSWCDRFNPLFIENKPNTKLIVVIIPPAVAASKLADEKYPAKTPTQPRKIEKRTRNTTKYNILFSIVIFLTLLPIL